MHAVILMPGWPGTFHRTVRNAEGKVLKVLEFAKDVPLELNDVEFAAVRNDIGKSLALAEVEHGKAVAKVAANQTVPPLSAAEKRADKEAAQEEKDHQKHGRK